MTSKNKAGERMDPCLTLAASKRKGRGNVVIVLGVMELQQSDAPIVSMRVCV